MPQRVARVERHFCTPNNIGVGLIELLRQHLRDITRIDVNGLPRQPRYTASGRISSFTGEPNRGQKLTIMRIPVELLFSLMIGDEGLWIGEKPLGDLLPVTVESSHFSDH